MDETVQNEFLTLLEITPPRKAAANDPNTLVYMPIFQGLENSWKIAGKRAHFSKLGKRFFCWKMVGKYLQRYDTIMAGMQLLNWPLHCTAAVASSAFGAFLPQRCLRCQWGCRRRLMQQMRKP